MRAVPVVSWISLWEQFGVKIRPVLTNAGMRDTVGPIQGVSLHVYAQERPLDLIKISRKKVMGELLPVWGRPTRVKWNPDTRMTRIERPWLTDGEEVDQCWEDEIEKDANKYRGWVTEYLTKSPPYQNGRCLELSIKTTPTRPKVNSLDNRAHELPRPSPAHPASSQAAPGPPSGNPTTTSSRPALGTEKPPSPSYHLEERPRPPAIPRAAPIVRPDRVWTVPYEPGLQASLMLGPIPDTSNPSTSPRGTEASSQADPFDGPHWPVFPHLAPPDLDPSTRPG